MSCLAWILAIALLGGQATADGERVWRNVQYLGGAPGVRGKSETWNNTLTVSVRRIRMESKKGLLFELDPLRITALSYIPRKPSKDMTDADIAAAAVMYGSWTIPLLSWVRIFTDHFLIVEYKLDGGQPAAILLRLHKNNHEAIVMALQEATGLKQSQPHR